MALGDRLVHELGLETSVDTLGRWMAHYLAELIERARNAEGEARIAAHAQAAELILKLWSKRRELPLSAYPLSDFAKALQVLERLTPEANPFSGYGRRSTDRFFGEAFDGLRILIMHGLLLATSAPTDSINASESEAFLDENERQIVEVINGWIDFLKDRRSSETRVVLISPSSKAADDKAAAEEAAAVAELSERDRAKRAFASDVDKLIASLERLKEHVSE